MASFVMSPLSRWLACSKHGDLHLHKQSVGRSDSSTSPLPLRWSTNLHVSKDHVKSWINEMSLEKEPLFAAGSADGVFRLACLRPRLQRHLGLFFSFFAVTNLEKRGQKKSEWQTKTLKKE